MSDPLFQSHAQIQSYLIDYSAHELAEQDRLQVERHLLQCPDCQKQLTEYQRIRSVLRTLSDPQQETSSIAEQVVSRLDKPFDAPDIDAVFINWEQEENLETINPTVGLILPFHEIKTRGPETLSRNHHNTGESQEQTSLKNERAKKHIHPIKNQHQAQKRRISQRLTALVAIIVVALVAGSFMVVLNILQQGHTAKQPEPSPTLFPATPTGTPLPDRIFFQSGNTQYHISPGDGSLIRSMSALDTQKVKAVLGENAVYELSWSGQPAEPALLSAQEMHHGRTFWSVEVQASSFWYAGLVATSSGIYITDDDGTIHAFHPQTGEKLWTYESGVPLIQTGPPTFIEVDGTLFTAFMNTLLAIDISNGDPIWSPITLDESIQLNSISIANDMIYTTGYNRTDSTTTIYAFTTTGQPGWTSQMSSDAGTIRVIPVQNTLFVMGTHLREIQTLNAQTGTSMQTISLQGFPDAIIADPTALYVTEEATLTGMTSLLKLDQTAGTVLWRSEPFAGNTEEIQIHGTMAYIITAEEVEADNGTLQQVPSVYALDTGDGSLIWTYRENK